MRKPKSLVALLLALCLFIPVSGLAAMSWDSPDVSWKKDTSPAEYSLFFNMSWAPFDVWGSDHVSQQVTKDTGISFEATKSQDANHMATIVATGELPDAFFVFGAKNTDMLEDPTVCYPWDELIAEYAPEFMDQIDPSEVQLATKADGHFYTLYTHVRNQAYWDDPTQGVSYGQSVIAFRDDIMAELGNPEIKDVEDFYKVLTQVKEKYPDMIPYLQQQTNADSLAYSFGIDFEGTKGMATIVDDQAIYTYSDKEPITDYLTFANQLMREGLMSQEALTYDFEKTKAAILGGDVFAFAGQAYDVDQINVALNEMNDQRYYTAARAQMTVGGEQRTDLTYASGGFAGFYITRAAKNPGRLIRLMQYMKSPYGDKLTQWGVEGLDYELKDGFPIQNETYTWKERGDNVWYFQASFAVENQKALAKAAIDPKYGQIAHLVTDYKPYWHYDPILALIGNAQANTKEGDIKTVIDRVKTDGFMAAIMAPTAEACAEAIASYFKALDDAGLADYNKFINDQYQAVKAK